MNPRNIQDAIQPASQTSVWTADIMTFDDLPDEVLQDIVFCLPPADIFSLQLTSSRLYRLSNAPLLWRHFCHTQYKFWDQKHRIREKFAGAALSVNWKELYASRHRVARKTQKALDDILHNETGRIAAFKVAVEPGYDIKDTLLRNINCEEHTEDILARRYVKLQAPSTRVTLTQQLLAASGVMLSWDISNVRWHSKYSLVSVRPGSLRPQ
jgi:hypothetical protein